jgi:hypothetical protein
MEFHTEDIHVFLMVLIRNVSCCPKHIVDNSPRNGDIRVECFT